MKKSKIETIKGITLIALVVTVIILMIIAGVATSLITGKSGLIEQTNFAGTISNAKSLEEAIRIELLKNQTEILPKDSIQLLKTKNFITEEEAGSLVSNPLTKSKYIFRNDGLVIILKNNTDVVVEINNGQYEGIEDDDGSYKFAYTGDYQTFIVPITGKYKIECWGAQGGDSEILSSIAYGGYTKGEINLNEGDKLYVYVGQAGNNTRTTIFNGGGIGGKTNGNSGGGATDVRLVEGNWDSFDSLKSRIMVAGAGGGSSVSTYNYSGQDGVGGGLIGYSGNYYKGHGNTSQFGKGGSQTAGGKNGSNIISGSGSAIAPKFGIGGNSNSTSSGTGAGGGGGGYYGGGAGGATGNGGLGNGAGGGSSFISGHTGCNAIDRTSTESNIIHTGQANHYSNFIFTNTLMLDGKGFTWNDVKETQMQMPNKDGGNCEVGEGNEGDGYAKITYLGPKEDKEFHYAYTNDYQTFTAPRDGKYKIECWGAQGGDVNIQSSPAYGGYTKGEINLKKGEKLYIYVGQAGNTTRTTIFNGGGIGGKTNGNSGGGATDIRLVSGNWDSFDSLKSRIMVAGAGGGSSVGVYSYSGQDGVGGGLTGYSGNYYSGHGNKSQYGTGGSQTAGGKNGKNIISGSGSAIAPKFGIGGNSNSTSSSTGAGGGGGGYYGGGTGGATGNGGYGNGAGGGSSFISGHNGCDAIDETSTSDNIVHTGQANHYSKFIFTNTLMIDGKGYEWTNVKGEQRKMPSNNGGNHALGIGNLGNGYVKITVMD